MTVDLIKTKIPPWSRVNSFCCIFSIKNYKGFWKGFKIASLFHMLGLNRRIQWNTSKYKRGNIIFSVERTFWHTNIFWFVCWEKYRWNQQSTFVSWHGRKHMNATKKIFPCHYYLIKKLSNAVHENWLSDFGYSIRDVSGPLSSQHGDPWHFLVRKVTPCFRKSVWYNADIKFVNYKHEAL